MFEFAPDGYLITTLDGKILEANRAASSLLGIAPRFLKGRGLGTSVAPEDLPAYSAALKALAASPAPTHAEEQALRLRRRHAGLFHAAVTVAPVLQEGQPPATLRWLIRDVTERRRAEEERLARARVQAGERQAMNERARRTADTLQRLLRPPVPADAFPHLSIETFFQAASDDAEISGDFFDIFGLDAGRVALVVGGVSGRGPSAATLTTEIKYALRVLLRQESRPATALDRLNDFACEARRLGDFSSDHPVALALAVVDPQTGEIALVMAGGDPLLVLRTSGQAERFGTAGQALGIQPGASYAEAQATLGAGDTLLVTSPAGELLGQDRFAELASAAQGADTLRGMGQAVLDGARSWAGGTLGNDACLLLARRRK